MTATTDKLSDVEQILINHVTDELLTRFSQVEAQIDVLETTLEHQVTLLGEIKDAIAPMLDKLASNPMFRMMFPDKD